jgi:hypothetical protein
MIPHLCQAYEATEYRAADGAGEAGVRIGRASPALDALLNRHGAGSGVFVTAWNPRSERTDPAANEEAAARLAAEVAGLGLRALPHHGVPDDADWEAEQGLFVLDLDDAGAVALAERYGQNAIVCYARGRPARLVATRLFGASLDSVFAP